MSGTIRAPLVVLGATGVVGRGVVQAAVQAGWPVIAVARNARALAALRAKLSDQHPHAQITVLTGSVANDRTGAKLAQTLRRLGRPLAGVIASVCGASERGRLLDHPAAFLRRKLDEDLLPHLAAARHLLPLLAQADRGASYVLIGGPGSEQPWAGYGHRSIGAAALRMLARVLHDEGRALSVRVQLLAIDTPVCSERNRAHACPQWPSAFAVGQRALALVEQRDTPRSTQAVVSYAAWTPHVAMSSADLWSDDIDREGLTSSPLQALSSPPMSSSPRADDVDCTPLRSTNRYAPADAAGTPPCAEQSADSDTSLLPARCLQDARTLLKTLLSPPCNQEPSQS